MLRSGYSWQSFERRDRNSNVGRRGSWARGIMPVLLAFAVLGVFAAGGRTASGVEPPAEDEYQLDSMDKVRLRIFEWRPSLDQVHEWKALNDEYTVGANGAISLPLIGNIRARGLTPSDLGRNVGIRMQQRIGVAEVPHISVEVVNFRPFYILGKVVKPGEYSFRPNLNVLQAISLAGGLMREDVQGQRLTRELISSQGDHRLHQVRYRALLSKRARLEADLAEKETIDFSWPEFDPSDPKTAVLMSQETEVLLTQRSEHHTKLTNLASRKEHLQEEIASLKAQIENHKSEAALAAEDLRIVKGLIEKRLTVEPRRMAAQRNVYQLNGDRLRLEAAVVRAQQETDKLGAAIEEMEKGRKAQMINDLRSTQVEIDDVAHRLATTRRLVLETAQLMPASFGGSEEGEIKPTYTIVRTAGGRKEHIQVSETSAIQPGDTIKVEFAASGLALVKARLKMD